MKKIQFKHILALTIISLTIIAACKRGEEDPGLTFRSREGRLVGTWELSEMASTKTVHREYSISNTVNANALDSTVDYTAEKNFSGGTLNYNQDRKVLVQIKSRSTTDDINFGDGAWERTEKYSIPQLKITFNKDYTFGITYEFERQSLEVCPWSKSSLSADWEQVDGCEDQIDDNKREYTFSESVVGTWHWVEGSVDEVQLGFDPLTSTMNDGFPETGFPLQYLVVNDDVESPIETIFGGKMLRLSKDEIKFVDDYTDEYDATTITDDEFLTDDREVTDTLPGRRTIVNVVEKSATYSSTWTKVEE